MPRRRCAHPLCVVAGEMGFLWFEPVRVDATVKISKSDETWSPRSSRAGCAQHPMFNIISFVRRALLPVNEAAARVFENHVGNGLQSGWKFLRQMPSAPTRMTWYDFPSQNFFRTRFPGMPHEAIGIRYERKVRRMKRGLLPVKKGQGKRQQKGQKASSKAIATPQAPAAAATAKK